MVHWQNRKITWFIDGKVRKVIEEVRPERLNAVANSHKKKAFIFRDSSDRRAYQINGHCSDLHKWIVHIIFCFVIAYYFLSFHFSWLRFFFCFFLFSHFSTAEKKNSEYEMTTFYCRRSTNSLIYYAFVAFVE